MLECPTEQARLAGPSGTITGASISDSWSFCIVHEIAHQCFALGLQIRQLLEKLQLLSVEIAGITLPPKYLDPETGRCCVLLGHLGDSEVPRGFNVTVPHQNQWILQSVLFVPAKLLTFEQCQMIRRDGADARRKLAESFVKDKSYSLSNIPPSEWPVSAPAAATTATTAQPAAAAPAGPQSGTSASTTTTSASTTAAAVLATPIGHAPVLAAASGSLDMKT